MARLNLIILPDGKESKYISLIRRFSQSSISEILNSIRESRYILSVEHSNIEALKTMKNVISELHNLGASIKIIETIEDDDMEFTYDHIDNLINRLESEKQYQEKIDDLMFGDDD